MPFWMSQVCDRMTGLWLSATPGDYFKMTTLVVVCGWILSRRWRAARPARNTGRALDAFSRIGASPALQPEHDQSRGGEERALAKAP